MSETAAITRNPDDETLCEAAALHCRLLPGSAISQFGEGFARSFYRYAARSQSEVVLAARGSGAVIAAAVLSLRPYDLQRRLLLYTPLLPHMAAHPLAALRVLRDRSFARIEGDFDPTLPEVIAIFTAPSHQGRGIGGQLLRAAEQELSTRGFLRYGLRTEDVAQNRAIDFYDRQGFTIVGRGVMPTGRFRIMTRQIGGRAEAKRND